MKKNNIALLFEKVFLNSLVEDDNSCVKIQDQNYHLALHPFHLNNINESLKDILNQSIAKYDKKLDGILLGYQNIKLLSQSGALTNDSCFIHLDIAASFYLFKPEVGKVLTGTVNKKSKDHVACLVHKTFNVSLPKPENVDDDDDDWMGTKVEIGQDILFRIIFINLDGRLPYIKAEFVALLGEQDSGISTSEENVENKPKKSKKIVFKSDSEDEETEPVKKKKKKKHKKEEDLENDDTVKEKKKKKHKKEEDSEIEGTVKEKKKKKHKKEDSENEDEVKGKRNKTKTKLDKEEHNFSENQNKEDKKRSHKKKHKHKDMNQGEDFNSLLLPDLNLSKLFSESVNSKSTRIASFQMADDEDKFSKKRRSSTSHVHVLDSTIELIPDPDLETILKDVDKKSKHKYKKEGCEEVSTKSKRKKHKKNHD